MVISIRTPFSITSSLDAVDGGVTSALHAQAADMMKGILIKGIREGDIATTISEVSSLVCEFIPMVQKVRVKLV